MSNNYSKTVITPVFDEEEVDETFARYSPVYDWNKSNDEVLLLSSDDEDNDKKNSRRSSVVALERDTQIVNKMQSEHVIDLDPDNANTSNKFSVKSTPKSINRVTSCEDCEILSPASECVINPKVKSVNEVFTIPGDPQCSRTISVQVKGSLEPIDNTSGRPNNQNKCCNRIVQFVEKDNVKSNEAADKGISVLQIDEIIDKCNVNVEDGVITIDDSDNELEICSTPPPNLRKRKVSYGSSPIAVCSKHMTTAVNSQHTDATLTFYLLSDIELISEKLSIEKKLVEKVVKMLVDDCTVPFISRYRQHDVQGLNNENIRKIAEAFKELKRAHKRVEEIERLLNKQNCFSSQLKETLSKCTNLADVERQYLPYTNEDEEAVRAKHLGLDKTIQMILEGVPLDAKDYVKIGCNGLESADKILSGWRSLIIDMICKDTEVMALLSRLYKKHVPVLETELDDDKVAEFYSDGRENIVSKYLRFNKWKMPINSVKTQAVFQINRGEREGLLRVYINFSEEIEKELRIFCMEKWKKCSPTILSSCIYLAWDNFMKPNFAQHIRWELTNEAHNVALNVFRENVKYLLLDEPIRGKTVLGIDPGYDHGCKLAVVSPWGVPIATSVVYVTSDRYKMKACEELKRLVLTFECNIIALGNGTGCREIEQLLVGMIQSNQFKPFIITYKIISESGVSYYSVSSEALQEFPDLPPNLISAVSIARRLQDPLSELVKTDPKKLEVGMYMRDIDSEKVEEVFNEVVIECVSFVGVDVNVASSVLLRKVSGITPEISENIIKTRTQNGPFKSRQELRAVEGVTSKQFEQFAGFIRILSETSQVDPEQFNYLDSTIIHPESYDEADKLLKYMGVEQQCIGSPYICEVIDHILTRFDHRDLAVFCNTNISVITFLLDAFKRPLNFDVRIDNNKRCYKPNVTQFGDIKPNMNLRGRVVNVTPIGAFIDVGLGGGHNAYLPPSNNDDILLNLVPRQIVLVQVTRVDFNARKLKVRLKKILE